MSSQPATYTTTFGEFLRQLRRRVGLTQGELAAAVGFSVAQISFLEKNERRPDLEVITEKFASALQLHDDPRLVQRLLELAAEARGEQPPTLALVERHVRTTIHKEVIDTTSNLPALTTTLVGRQHELEQICKRLMDAPGRLLTLIGAPGVGKTQLGVAVALKLQSLFAEGAYFVALASVTTVEHVAAAILSTLRVSEASTKAPMVRLVETLRRKTILLVLDNLEHLSEIAPLVAELLSECAGLRILATSRAPLRLRAEQRQKVPPLTPAAAVELFLQRARAIDPEFVATESTGQLLTQLCLQLDCLPLAIELIAAHIDLLTPQQMCTQLLERGLDLLDDGAQDLPHHQRTLRTAIGRSYQLLGEQEQALFRACTVFTGGFMLEAVLEVAAALIEPHVPIQSLLSALVNKSLLHVQSESNGGRRLLMLETLREFAHEQSVLQAEEEIIQQRHARYFAALATQVDHHLRTGDQAMWLDQLEREHDNLRAALRWLIGHDAEAAQQMGGALRRFWFMRGHFVEGRRWLEEALAASELPTLGRANALLAAGHFAQVQDQMEEGLRLVEESLVLFRRFNDRVGMATALNEGGWMAHSLTLGVVARSMFEEGLLAARQIGDLRMVADLLVSLGQAIAFDLVEADFARARRYFEESLALCRQQNRRDGVAQALSGYASLEFMSGHNKKAAELCAEAATLYEQLGFQRNVAINLTLWGQCEWFQGHVGEAEAKLRRAEGLYHELEIPWGLATTSRMLVLVALQQNDLAQASRQALESLRLVWQMQDQKQIGESLYVLAGVRLASDDPQAAARLAGAAQALIDSLPRFLTLGFLQWQAATVEKIRAALAEEQFAREWQAGQTMPLAEIVEAVL